LWKKLYTTIAVHIYNIVVDSCHPKRKLRQLNNQKNKETQHMYNAETINSE